MTYDWVKLKKELEDRLTKSVPADLTFFAGLVDGLGYCEFCRQKKVLFYNRITKKWLCIDCCPAIEMEYTAIEFNNMWQLAQDTLYYANEIILELMYPNLDFTPITPEKFVTYLTDHGWTEKIIKNDNVRMFNKEYKYKSIPMMIVVPAITGLEDYHQCAVHAIDLISKVDGLTPYEVFQRISSL